MAPSYVVPLASDAVMWVNPVLLMVMGSPFGSNAKLLGAKMAEPFVVQSEVSSSAMKALMSANMRERFNHEAREGNHEEHETTK